MCVSKGYIHSTIVYLTVLLSSLVKQYGDQRLTSAKGAHVMGNIVSRALHRPQLKVPTFGFKYREASPVFADTIAQYIWHRRSMARASSSTLLLGNIIY